MLTTTTVANCFSFRQTYQRRALPKTQSGFSMLELMIVVSIVLVLAAIALYNVQPAIQAVRLHGAASDYGDLLQNARIRAVRDDKYYTVLTNPGANPPMAFVDINGNGAYDLGEPMVEFRSNTTPAQFSSGPALANLESQFLPQNGIGSLVTTAAGPTFGPRGLPCTPTPAVNGSTTCPYITPTSFVTFLQDSYGAWAAVTVTPAARVREWSYNPNTANWSSQN